MKSANIDQLPTPLTDTHEEQMRQRGAPISPRTGEKMRDLERKLAAAVMLLDKLEPEMTTSEVKTLAALKELSK